MTNKYSYLLSLTLAVTAGVAPIHAFSPDSYASSSRLAAGKWAKIRVTETGMQLITTAQLRNLGFSDPSKVRVYGYGGRMISETLDGKSPDDLPMLPSVATAKGIVFFGTDRTSWKQKGSTNSSLYGVYDRVQNPYSLDSYYFLSDSDPSEPQQGAMPAATPSASPMTTFRAHLLHEKEMQAPSNSGRDILGEDFRAQTSQSFPFKLTDYAGGDIDVVTLFGSYITNGTPSLSVTVNGKAPQGSDRQNIEVTKGSNMLSYTTCRRTFSDVGDNAAVGLKFNPSGVVNIARLDYMMVEYERNLRLNGGELWFYHVQPGATTYSVSGCSASTAIWDVTDPARPLRVEATAQGDKLTFAADGRGYREFIAFDADKVSRTVAPAGSVANQDIHSLTVPDMLIISPTQYTDQARRIAALHEEDDGMRVHIVTPEALYNEFSSGTPDVSAFRKALKMWYDRGEQEGHRLQYCLILSRPTYDNLGVSDRVRNLSYPRVPIWQQPILGGTASHDSNYSTDDIIAILDDNSVMNGNSRLSIAVGRMPFTSPQVAKTMVDKMIKYVKEPEYGAWRNNIILFADDQDHGDHLQQSENMYHLMLTNGTGSSYNFERIYLDSYPRVATGTGFQYPNAKANLLKLLDEGALWWSYIGHGNPRSLTHEKVMEWTDITTMTNSRPFILYGPTCEFMRWDDDDISGGEIMWLYPEGGSIAQLIATRSVGITPNGNLTRAIGANIFTTDENGEPLRLGEILRRAKNDIFKHGITTDTNRFRFHCLGDPAMRVPCPVLQLVVDEINGQSLDSGVMPEIGTNDKLVVSGYVADAAGNPVDDFNGTIEMLLYDAERVMQGLGNGGDDDAAEKVYNDRVSRLGKVREVVKDGRWNSTMFIPSMIENNYSPALLSMYAYSDNGREANGSCEQFYVYGEGSGQGDSDTQGPEIEMLTLNSSSFTPGDIVNESPVVLAKINDPSGINIYGGVIGQEPQITVDGKTYADVRDFYQPELGDPCSGSITYPLSTLEPGDHELSLTVFDNFGNFTTATVPFRVAIGTAPNIYDVNTDVNPATTSVNFILSHDRPSEMIDCVIDVFDLSGRKVWSGNAGSSGRYDTTMRVAWDLCDGSGARVPRGIYLYRATVTTTQGTSASKTRKLAVTAR